MRRIIERVVTVVTTTTWKISWEADPPQSDSPEGSLPSPAVLSTTVHDNQTSTVDTKEADLREREEKTTNQIADEPLPKP